MEKLEFENWERPVGNPGFLENSAECLNFFFEADMAFDLCALPIGCKTINRAMESNMVSKNALIKY